jgi:uncharacterized protein (DUF2147 family)
MKYLIHIITLFIVYQSLGQTSVLGKWKTIDDESGKERSIIELYEQKGLVFGRVVKTIPQPGEDPDPVCDKCEPDDPRYNKKIIGMEILKNMKLSGDEYTDGNILDPENGKIYRCKIWVEAGNLMVRGYWGPFFRTQIWKKVH